MKTLTAYLNDRSIVVPDLEVDPDPLFYYEAARGYGHSLVAIDRKTRRAAGFVDVRRLGYKNAREWLDAISSQVQNPVHETKGPFFEIRMPGETMKREYFIANPDAWRYAVAKRSDPRAYLFAFGAYGDTRVVVLKDYGVNNLDDAMDVAGEWVEEFAPGVFVAPDYPQGIEGVNWDDLTPEEIREIEDAESDLTRFGDGWIDYWQVDDISHRDPMWRKAIYQAAMAEAEMIEDEDDRHKAYQDIRAFLRTESMQENPRGRKRQTTRRR